MKATTLTDYEVIRLVCGYAVARKNLEIEAVFDTRVAAKAYILIEVNNLSSDSDELATALDRLLIRRKRSAFAKLISGAVKDDWCAAGEKSISNRKLFATALARVNDRYLINQLETVSSEELQALETLGIAKAIYDWLNYIGRIGGKGLG